MRYLSWTALLFSLVLAACSGLGCSDESTAPDNPPSSIGEHLWSKRFGDGDPQIGTAIAADVSGNVIVAGYFEGAVDFGGGLLTSAGSEDIFVAKFGPGGAHVWSRRFGDGSGQFVPAIATDVSGNVIVAGYFEGTVDFGGGLLTAVTRDIFVAKFSPDGDHVWSKRFGDEGYRTAPTVAIDVSGNVVVSGGFMGNIDFGGGALTSADSWPDIFVAKFGPNGDYVWSKRFGDENDQSAEAVTVDASGNVIVTGYFYNAVDFGGGALTSTGYSDGFVAKLGSDGAHVWSKRFGDVSYQGVESVDADGSGNVIVAGSFSGTVDFGGGALTSAGMYDIYVAKFGSEGAHLWSKRFGDAGDQRALSVTVDASANAMITGWVAGTVDFGGGAFTSAGSSDIFVAKFDPSAVHVWSKRFGDEDYQGAQAVAVDASGNVIVAGSFSGTVDFGGNTLTSAGNSDIVVAKFSR